MLHVCVSLKSFSLERVASFGFFPFQKKLRVTSSLLSCLLNTHRESRPSLFLLKGPCVALQRAAWSSGEICQTCLENSGPCSPRRDPSIIGLARSLCSFASTLSPRKSLLSSSSSSCESHSCPRPHSCTSFLSSSITPSVSAPTSSPHLSPFLLILISFGIFLVFLSNPPPPLNNNYTLPHPAVLLSPPFMLICLLSPEIPSLFSSPLISFYLLLSPAPSLFLSLLFLSPLPLGCLPHSLLFTSIFFFICSSVFPPLSPPPL